MSIVDKIKLDGIAENANVTPNSLMNGYVTQGQLLDTTEPLGQCATAEGSENIASEECSHAEGFRTQSTAFTSHAEGNRSVASGEGSHAEGDRSVASGKASHAEGSNTGAQSMYSHAEGYRSVASGEGSHAEGNFTIASGNYSHAEGYGTEASGKASHAEGNITIASGAASHAEGANSEASGAASHAEGNSTLAQGMFSHAEGSYCKSLGDYSHAEGYLNYATNISSSVCGKYCKVRTDTGTLSNQLGDAFVVGNGIANNLSNGFRVTYAGTVYGVGNYNSSGADYAEFIYEWHDGNPNDEDRVGYFVTVKNQLLYKANSEDPIVGITSGNPSVVGNADEDYYWKYQRDEFNRFIWEDSSEMIEKLDENNHPIIDKETGLPIMIETDNIVKNGKIKINPEYNQDLEFNYIERKDRPEWDYVGMLGVLPLRDDGTCEVGRYCRCGEGGVGTKATERTLDTYLVLERITDNIIKVLLK